MSTDFIPPTILPSWVTGLLPTWVPGWLGDDLTQVGVVAVFAIVYLGMFFGGLPHVRLDRTGVALRVWSPIGPGAGATVGKTAGARDARETEPALDRLESAKGLLVATTLMVLFLFTDVNREVAALVGAGVLLLSRRLHSAEVMGTVDWPLLLLFIGLFIVNHAFAQTGLAAQAVQGMAAWGVHLEQAGMLLVVGSIANLIVVGLAERAGVVIDWKQHARIGIPVTLLSLALLWFCWQVLGIQPPPKVSS